MEESFLLFLYLTASLTASLPLSFDLFLWIDLVACLVFSLIKSVGRLICCCFSPMFFFSSRSYVSWCLMSCSPSSSPRLSSPPTKTGFWPFNYSLCNVWVSSDVLFSSASIYHMVFISIGRFIGIRNPLRARQAFVSRRGVIYKIFFAWLLSALISCPITILAIIDPLNIQPDPRSCLIDNPYFQIFGKCFRESSTRFLFAYNMNHVML